MFGRKSAARAAFVLLLAACTGDAGSPLAPEASGPQLDLSDAAHAGAVPGFYFLPPMVPQPVFSGTFDAAVSPRVEICELSGTSCGTVIAQFTTTGGSGSEVVKVDPAQQTYAVNWHTDAFSLNVAKTYRIGVFVGAFRLGYADVDPVSTGKEMKNVDTNQYIALVNGRTLPIKFRIETGIVAAVDVAPDSATILPGQTQQFTATLTDLHGNSASAPVTWATSATVVATIDGTGLATGVAQGTVTVTATSGAASATATLVVANPNTPPTATDDAYEAIGNVTVPVAAPGVLANDTDAETGSLTATPGTFATASGGTVTLSADGGFSYLSAPGFTGSDSFSYVVSDGLAADTATAQVTVASRVWYVKNDAVAPGDGRDASPFTTLKAAESASSTGETLFLLAGSGTAGTDEGIVLKPSQALTGQGVSSNITTTLNGQSVVLLASGISPQVTRSTPGATIQLATGNTVQGVSIASTAGPGIAGSGFGNFTSGNVSVSAVGGPALDLENGVVAASFTVLSSTGSGGAGLRLHGLSGILSAAGGSIGGATGVGVEISGGTANIGYAGSVTSTDDHVVSVTGRSGGTVTLSGDLHDTGTGILVQNNSGGTIAFTGSSKVLDTGSAPAVSLLANTGAAVSFNGGGLSITTTTGTGFRATGGGTVIVTGANNAIVSAGGTALSVVNTTIGSGGLTFRSISASGGANGIVLDNTGSGFGLQVTGTGSPGSGGTIRNTVGADGTTAGIGVYLHGTRNVELSWMQLNDHPNFAIRGVDVADFQMDRSRITGTNGTDAATDEGSIHFSGLQGASAITNSRIEGALEHNVRVVNTSGVLNRLTMSNDTIGANSTTLGDDGISLDASGGTFNVTVQNSRFTSTRGDQFQLLVQGAASSDLVFTGNTLSNSHPSALAGGVNVSVAQSGNLMYNISNNAIRDARGTALVVAKQFGGGAGNGTAGGTIQGNTIGASGVTNSGSLVGSGIEVLMLARGAHTALVQNNQVRGYNNHGILVTAGGVSESATGLVHDGQMNVTVQGNTIAEPGNNPAISAARNGIHLNSGTSAGDDYQVCLDLSGNAVAGSGANPSGSSTQAPFATDFRLRQRQSTTVRLPGYTGAATDASATLKSDLTGYLAPRTSGSFTLDASAQSTGFVNTSGGAGCTLP